MVEIAHPYMTTENNTPLTIYTFVSKVMLTSLSRFVIVFLPRSKHIFLNFMVAVTIPSDFGAPPK